MSKQKASKAKQRRGSKRSKERASAKKINTLSNKVKNLVLTNPFKAEEYVNQLGVSARRASPWRTSGSLRRRRRSGIGRSNSVRRSPTVRRRSVGGAWLVLRSRRIGLGRSRRSSRSVGRRRCWRSC